MSEGVDLIARLKIPGYGGDEVGLMEKAISVFAPDFIADWGTNVGSSARIFYELSKLYGKSPKIVTTDLYPELADLDRDHARERTGHLLDLLPVERFLGDGVTESLLAYITAGSPRRSLFFIDGDHSFANVVRELESVNHLAPTAIVLLHDTWDEPGDAILTFMNGNPSIYSVEFLASQAGMSMLVPKCLKSIS